MPAVRANGRVSVSYQRDCMVETSETVAGMAIPSKAWETGLAIARGEAVVRKIT